MKQAEVELGQLTCDTINKVRSCPLSLSHDDHYDWDYDYDYEQATTEHLQR